MSSQIILFASTSAVIASALISGVFLAFSDFIMKSLAAAHPASGIQSMQLINRKVYGSVFLALLVGMSVAAVVFAVYAFLNISGPAAMWIIAGSASYVLGVFIVTMVYNVPMNQRLDAMDHTYTETATYWTQYVSSWTSWNHVRTVASAGSAICFQMGSLLLNT